MSKDSDQVVFIPRNKSQKKIVAEWHKRDVMILLGAAGVGKTVAAMAMALKDVLNPNHPAKKIYLTRPAVEASERLGYLPGDIKEKFAPYIQPMLNVFKSVTHIKPETILDKYIECVPIAYMQGLTFDNGVLVVSEAENCTISQLRLILTRIGSGGKICIEGDPDQSHINNNGNALVDVADALEGLEVTDSDGKTHSVGIIDFDPSEVVRHPMITSMLQRLVDL